MAVPTHLGKDVAVSSPSSGAGRAPAAGGCQAPGALRAGDVLGARPEPGSLCAPEEATGRRREAGGQAGVSPSHEGVVLRSAWLATPKGSRWRPLLCVPAHCVLDGQAQLSRSPRAQQLLSVPRLPWARGRPLFLSRSPAPSAASPAGAAGGGGGGAAGTVSSPPFSSPPRATEKDKGTGHRDPGQ